MRVAYTALAALAVLATSCSLDFDRLRKPRDASMDASMDAPADAPVGDDCGPRAEVCGGGDEDCDGSIDEVMEPCVDTICGEGVRTCDGDMLGPCSTQSSMVTYEVEADALISAMNPTQTFGSLSVMNLSTGPGLVQFPADADLSRLGQLTVRAHRAVCAEDCDPGSDCLRASYRGTGTVLLVPLASRFDEGSVTFETPLGEGDELARTPFDTDTATVDLVATVAADAATSRAFALKLLEPVVGAYLVRTHELADGDSECAGESPATQLIVHSCPEP